MNDDLWNYRNFIRDLADKEALRRLRQAMNNPMPLSELERRPEVLTDEGKAQFLRDARVPKRYAKAQMDGIVDVDLYRGITSYCDHLSERLRRGTGLTLIGGTGIGKSMAASLVVKRAYDTFGAYSGVRIRWSDGPELAQLLLAEKYGRLEDKATLYSLRAAALLVIDELDRGCEFDSQAPPLLDTFIESRHGEELPTVVTSNADLTRLEALGLGRAVSRLHENSMMVVIAGEDRRKKH